MRKRSVAWITICLTVAGAIAAQLSFEYAGIRIHQHRIAVEVSGNSEYNPLDCINGTEESAYQYDKDAVDLNKFVTHLPLVIIDTEEAIPGIQYYDEDTHHAMYTKSSEGEEDTVANMKIICRDGQYHTPEDDPDVKTQIRIKVRGNTSRRFEKKSYAVKTIHSNGENKNLALLGMEENHDWVLHGPFLDKTLIRNYMAMNISGELMDYAPDVRFCEVIINGEYKGVYVLMETVSRGTGRIQVEKPNYTKNVSGYIIELDNTVSMPDTAMVNFTKYAHILRENAYFNIRYPGAIALTPEIKDYIERDVSKFEKALYSFDYDTKDYGYQNYIDVDEFVDYFIIMEVFLQHDTGNLSTFFYKAVNGEYRPCVWDFNNDLENITTITEDDFYIRKFVTVQSPWFLMMLKDEAFTERIINRYRQLREGILSDEYLTDYIEETIAFLGEAVDRNYAVWGFSFEPSNLDSNNKLHPVERNPRTYEEAVTQMKEVLLQRLDWLDHNIVILKQYSHESAVKKYNH